MTGPGGTEADRAAREQLAREARATATTLLDWVGTRVDGVATARAAGGSRPRQSAGPCTWCPVCTLVAALRGEQPELTAHLAEQASALLVVLRLLIQSHAHEHPAHEHPAHAHPFGTPGGPAAPDPTAGGAAGDAAPADEAGPEDVPAHARFDPDPAPPAPAPAPAPDGTPGPAPDRPTGKRGPRPSPRPRPTGDPAPTAAPAPEPTPTTPAPAAPTPPAPGPTATRTPPPAVARSTRGVQRIPVRRRTRPC